MFNVASSSQTNDSQATLDDDDLFNDLDLLVMLATIEEACAKEKNQATSNPISLTQL